MEGLQGGQHLQRDVRGHGYRERPVLEPRGERFTFEQFHDEEQGVVLLLDRIQLADVGVTGGSRRAGFPPQAFSYSRAAVRGTDHLQRDLTAKPLVLGHIDDTLSALAELVDDPVSTDSLDHGACLTYDSLARIAMNIYG